MHSYRISTLDKLRDWNSTRKARIIFYQVTRQSTRKIVIGANNMFQKDWIPVEINVLNILKAKDWKRYFIPNTIDAILAEHVWEHLTPKEGVIAAAFCYTYLKPGGYLRLAVPDGYHNNFLYLAQVKPDGSGPGSGDHKVLYTYKKLEYLLKYVGFAIKRLEYFDEHHRFHFTDWKKKDGFIRRSKRYDERNTKHALLYTSLIVDAIK